MSDEPTTESEVEEVAPEQSEDLWPDSAKAYIRGLKGENKSWREKADQYEKLYGQNSELRQFHEAATAYAAGDMTPVQEFIIANAAQLAGLSIEDYMARFEEPDEPEDDDDKPLTRREMREMLQAQAQAQATQRQQEEVAQIHRDVEAISGFAPGSMEFMQVMWVATHQTNGDLEKATETVKGLKQGAIDEYVKEQREKALNALKPQTPNGQSPDNSAREPQTLKEASKGAMEFLLSREM